MEETAYVSVPLDEYCDLVNLRDFFFVLRSYGVEDWDFWEDAVRDFLEDEALDALPYD